MLRELASLEPTCLHWEERVKEKKKKLKIHPLCWGSCPAFCAEMSPLNWEHMIKVWTVIPGPYLLLGSKYHLLTEIEISGLYLRSSRRFANEQIISLLKMRETKAQNQVPQDKGTNVNIHLRLTKSQSLSLRWMHAGLVCVLTLQREEGKEDREGLPSSAL